MADNPSKPEALRALADPLPLRGIGTLHVDPDQVLVQIRTQQTKLARAKLASLHGGADKR